MTEKSEFELNTLIFNKDNSDLIYTIVEKKYMNGILHYLLESKSSSNSIYLSEYAIKDRFVIMKNEPSNVTKPSISNLYSKITKSVNKEN